MDVVSATAPNIIRTSDLSLELIIEVNSRISWNHLAPSRQKTGRLRESARIEVLRPLLPSVDDEAAFEVHEKREKVEDMEARLMEWFTKRAPEILKKDLRETGVNEELREMNKDAWFRFYPTK